MKQGLVLCNTDILYLAFSLPRKINYKHFKVLPGKEGIVNKVVAHLSELKVIELFSQKVKQKITV